MRRWLWRRRINSLRRSNYNVTAYVLLWCQSIASSRMPSDRYLLRKVDIVKAEFRVIFIPSPFTRILNGTLLRIVALNSEVRVNYSLSTRINTSKVTPPGGIQQKNCRSLSVCGRMGAFMATWRNTAVHQGIAHDPFEMFYFIKFTLISEGISVCAWHFYMLQNNLP